MKTYQIDIRQGYSDTDHLAPLGVATKTYPSLRAARVALEEGRQAQGPMAQLSRHVRCDIVRSDGRRFDWQ